eukprot:6039286-Pleurochrysis_carterae.AAC.1
MRAQVCARASERSQMSMRARASERSQMSMRARRNEPNETTWAWRAHCTAPPKSTTEIRRLAHTCSLAFAPASKPP